MRLHHRVVLQKIVKMAFRQSVVFLLLPLSFFSLVVVVAETKNEANVIRVHYGYFPEARPTHAACARGWLDLLIPAEMKDGADTRYNVTCYPQTSGSFAASRLDSGQLHIAQLGSTPLAEAVARGIDLKVIYISHYMGESQGIYARTTDNEMDFDPYFNPLDLVNRTVGVPFGSTMHYQLLFLLDLLGLKGQVNVSNLSPTAIMQAWDDGTIDAAACWGEAREHVLSKNAATVVSAGTLANWGSPTFVVVAANRMFAEEHTEFLQHFLAIISRINDSFEDRVGDNDRKNIIRWQSEHNDSLIPSMSDSLMNRDEKFQDPSSRFNALQRQILESFVTLTASEQLSSKYLPPAKNSNSNSNRNGNNTNSTLPLHPSTLQLATHRTAQFMLKQKVIGFLGIIKRFKSTSTNSNMIFDGSFLGNAQRDDRGYPTGPYKGITNSTMLLDQLEKEDRIANRSRYAPNEIGRFARNANSSQYLFGDSTCMGHEKISLNESFPVIEIGDGANADMGKTYSTDRTCSWEIRAPDCQDDLNENNCTDVVVFNIDRMRIWSGDYIRIYTDSNFYCNSTIDPTVTLLAQFSSAQSAPGRDEFRRPIRARGCLYVEFSTDNNQEQSYGDSMNMGNGFHGIATIENIDNDEESSPFCHDLPMKQGLCVCDGFHWGGDCSVTHHCLGTNKIILSENDSKSFASSSSVIPETLLNLRYVEGPINQRVAYPNDLNCVFEIVVESSESHVEVTIYYDVEDGFDFIWLESGKGETYYVFTGSRSETYYVPVDSWSRKIRLRMTTDSRGRRGGFYATARAVTKTPRTCRPGYSGGNCEIPYCLPNNELVLSPRVGEIKNSFLLGRGYSQASGKFVRAMPWAPSGGCNWDLSEVKDVEALRLIFDDFDLEPYPEPAVGDKLVISTGITTGNKSNEYFVQECKSDKDCGFDWQDGVCLMGGCAIRKSIDINITNSTTISNITVSLITDRNDGEKHFSGIIFDALKVIRCPSEKGEIHCELAKNSKCLHGGCICAGGIPCSCPCPPEGPPPRNPLVLVIIFVLPTMTLIVILIIYWYQTKVRKLKALKEHLGDIRTAIIACIPAGRHDYDDDAERALPQLSQYGSLLTLIDPPASQLEFADNLPDELRGQPQMVLLEGDIIQILPPKREDGWAWGTKLHHKNEASARKIMRYLTREHEEDGFVSTDTGWFQLNATEDTSADDLAMVLNNIGSSVDLLKTPSNWDEATSSSNSLLCNLDKNDPEYRELINEFMSPLVPFPGRVEVDKVEVERIQNLSLWQSYVVKRHSIVRHEMGLQANNSNTRADADDTRRQERILVERVEKRLWHGTTVENIEKITQQGFNRSFCGRNATYFGKGVYFARDASYSARDDYAVPDKNDFKYILACRVAVGEYCQGRQDALTPDTRNENTESLYDTTVDSTTNPSIFVIFNDAQAYPEYLIKFKLLPGQ